MNVPISAELPAWDPFARDCPSRGLLDSIGDKWSILIVLALADGAQRYGELAKAVGGISQKMLAQRLHLLVDDGLITRTEYRAIPPRVEYELTPLGQSAVPVFRGLVDWVVSHVAEVRESRGET